MEWKAEIQNINGVKQLLWECGNKKGTMMGDFSTEPDDLVAFVKEFFGEERVKEIEEEGKVEIQPIDMEKMFEEMFKNANS